MLRHGYNEQSEEVSISYGTNFAVWAHWARTVSLSYYGRQSEPAGKLYEQSLDGTAGYDLFVHR